MASERERDELRAALAEWLNPELAEVLMESLPPRRWDELATREDLRGLDGRMDSMNNRMDGLEHRMDGLEHRMDGLEHRMDGLEHRLDEFERRTLDRFTGIEKTLERYDERFVSLEHRLVAEFRKQTVDQTRLLFFSMIGAIFTTASLAFAAARF